MNIYQVFSVHNTLISAHDNAAAALKHALIYQHATGKPAHVEQVPTAPIYEVQTLTICDGWINTWHEYDDDNNEIPMQFDSFEAALMELDNYIDDYQDAYEAGDIESPEDRSHYRIVEVKPCS